MFATVTESGDYPMATHKAKPKLSTGGAPASKKGPSTKTTPREVAADGRVGPAKAQPAPKADNRASPDEDAPFNAETAKVLREADAGENLLNYPSLEAMFEDLGI
jgi:hypothetical protein